MKTVEQEWITFRDAHGYNTWPEPMQTDIRDVFYAGAIVMYNLAGETNEQDIFAELTSYIQAKQLREANVEGHA